MHNGQTSLPHTQPPSQSHAEFTVNQLVALKADPTQIGVVREIHPATPENRYTVFLDGKSQPFYASQLHPVHPVHPVHPEFRIPSSAFLFQISNLKFLFRHPSSLIPLLLNLFSLTEFHAHLTALQIRHPSASAIQRFDCMFSYLLADWCYWVNRS